MPIYDYSCRECQSQFEAMLPADRRDTQPATCPQCGTIRTIRKISLTAPAVVKSVSSDRLDCGAPGGCCGGRCASDFN